MCLPQFFMCFQQFFSSPPVHEAQGSEVANQSNLMAILAGDLHVQQFLNAIVSLPKGQPLDRFLQRAVNYEEYLRKIFANDRGHPDLANPLVGLFDVFSQKTDVWKVMGRPVGESHDDHFIMPLSPHLRKIPGALSIVPTINEFKYNWNIFTHNLLSNISWSNVIAAGGSVLACLEPFQGNPSLAQRNERYRTIFAASDIDLFLWGLNPSQAEAKMVEIYETIRNTVASDVICVRKSNVVSIHTLFPGRPIQIILRLYLSPAEILAGFDIDSACFAYNGHQVWASPRALASCIRQANTIDLTRRSPSYEVRLAKYAERGYEVYLPSLSRERIDASIFSHLSPKRPNGLARLLILERLYFSDPVLGEFLDYPWKRVLIRGGVCAGPGHLQNISLESSDYDIMWVIPYGPRWTPGRIARSVVLINNRLNGSWPLAEAGRQLHRHPLFAGSMPECLENFCPGCPTPNGEEEEQLVAAESSKYIRGRIRFIEANPGQQLLTGSFQPLDMKGWEDDAYGTTDQDGVSDASHEEVDLSI